MRDGFIESVSLNGNIYLHYKYQWREDVFTVFDQAAKQWRNVTQEAFVRTLLPSQLPFGWTRTAGNSDFYSEVALGKLFIYQVTASSYKKYDIGHLPPRGPIDVSPSGAEVIYSVREYKNGRGWVSNIYIRRLNNLTEQLILPGELRSVQYRDHGQVAVLTKANGSQQGVDLRTLTVYLPQLPEGWTRTKSNTNFAYLDEPDSHGKRNLKVMDLLSGKVQVVFSYNPKIFSINPDVDVVMGGKVVAYSVNRLNQKQQIIGQTLVFALLSDPRKKVSINSKGWQVSIRYDGATVIVTRTNGKRTQVFKVEAFASRITKALISNKTVK